MKDSSGRYWCISCGVADQKKKSASLARPAKAKGPGLFAGLSAMGSGGTDKARLVKMLIVMGLLAAGAAWRFSTLH